MFLTGIIFVLHRYFVRDLIKVGMFFNTLQADKPESITAKRLK